MSRLDRIQARVRSRILESTEALTVVYPAIRPVVVGTAPVTGPQISPLLGPEAEPEMLVTTSPTTSAAPVTLPCLWLDSFGNLVLSLQTERVKAGLSGWYASATAMARVLVSDAALDPDDPWGDTVFTGADYVEHSGHRYQVVAVDGLGASMGPPVTYYVWLRGAAKQ